jgi:broad specificity phosphatase PhoE
VSELITAASAVLVRHAETEWSLSGQHTGRTDLPLTDHGRETAAGLAGPLSAWSFSTVLVSPSLRARETCELCGLAGTAEPCEDLLEWDYGDYEGLTSPQIEELRPGWNLWRDGCQNGESAAKVGTRIDRVIARIAASDGPVAVFSHGHALRALGARWIGLEASGGARLGLSTASISALGVEHGTPVLASWNDALA